MATYYTIDTVLEAGERVFEWISKNKGLPQYVTIGGCMYSMPIFLDLAVRTVLQIESKNSNSLLVRWVVGPNMNSPVSPSGRVLFSNYMDAGSRLYGYINQYLRVPASLGTTIGQVGFNEMVYMYSFVCAHYKRNQNLPSHIDLGNGQSGRVKTGLWLALENALGKVFNTAEEMASAFKNYYDYEYYYNDKKKPAETIEALKHPGPPGVNCVDVSQIVMEILEAMGYSNVNIWRGTFNCGGHVWVTFGPDNRIFDAAGMMKYGYGIGQYMCSGKPWDLQKNPAWAVSDDGIT